MSKITEFRKSGKQIVYTKKTDYDVYYIGKGKNNIKVVIKADYKEYYGVKEIELQHPYIKGFKDGELLSLKGAETDYLTAIIRKKFKPHIISYIEKQQQLLANNNTQKSIIRQQKITGIDNELKPLNSNTEFDDFDFSGIEPVKEIEEDFSFDEIKTVEEDFEPVKKVEDDFRFDEIKTVEDDFDFSNIEPVKEYDFEDFDFEEDKTTAMDFDFEEIKSVEDDFDFEEVIEPVAEEEAEAEDFSFNNSVESKSKLDDIVSVFELMLKNERIFSTNKEILNPIMKSAETDKSLIAKITKYILFKHYFDSDSREDELDMYEKQRDNCILIIEYNKQKIKHLESSIKYHKEETKNGEIEFNELKSYILKHFK